MSFPKYPEYKDSGIEVLTTIPIHWQVMFMKRFAQLAYGNALPADMRGEDGQIPVYGSNGIVGIHSVANTKYPVMLVGRKGSYGALNWSDQAVFAIDTVYLIDDNYCSANLRWLFWALHIADFRGYSQDTGIPGLSRSVAHDTCLPFPSPQEQSAIAAFLDHETAKIDALVAEQEKLIELLKEKRQAVISHAVTKGLDPSVPMKDSGVEWLGEVPEHWEVKRLKFVAYVQGGVTKGRDLGDSKTVEVPFLRVANVQDGYLDLNDIATIDVLETELTRYLLHSGDVLMNEGGDFDKLGRGHVWRGEIDPCIHQNHVFAVRPTGVDPEWLNLLTSSYYGRFYFMSRSKQSTNLASISSTNILEFPLLVPPSLEQQAIITHVAVEINHTNALIDESQRAIDLLKERRSALISAAVTGKIDVRGFAPVSEAV